MGLYEYNILTLREKADLLWDIGIYLAVRADTGYNINLYSFSNFFVEVWYDRKNNEIADIRTFKSREQLQPYVDSIDINSLL